LAKLDPKETLNIIKDTAKEKNKKNLPRRVNNLQFNPSIKEGIDDEELTFHHSIDTSGRHQYDIYSNNKNNGYGGHVAGATLRKDKPVISSVMVRPEYRRQGVATKLYNHIEKEHNIKLRPNDALTDDGKKFWGGRKESLKESNDLDNKASETHKTHTDYSS
jgi:GNAT superfamily N-acetyltransferase